MNLIVLKNQDQPPSDNQKELNRKQQRDQIGQNRNFLRLAAKDLHDGVSNQTDTDGKHGSR